MIPEDGSVSVKTIKDCSIECTCPSVPGLETMNIPFRFPCTLSEPFVVVSRVDYPVLEEASETFWIEVPKVGSFSTDGPRALKPGQRKH